MNSQKIALLTDSCADLPVQTGQDAPIYVAPLRILCGDGEFLDGVNIFQKDIYRRLEAGELPRTSLPAGGSITHIFDQIAAAGYEKVLAITLSSGLSGTYNLLRLLGENWDGLEVAVFDSLSGSLGMGSMVLQAWEDIQAGMSWEELVGTRVPQLIRSTFPFFSVDTLEYLQKGGRIGKITALAGTMLSIKPLIGFSQDGQLQSVAKVRGRRGVQDRLLELVRASLGDHRRYNLAVANGGAPGEMARLAGRMAQEFPHFDHFWQGELDATLSVYIGSGVLGACVQVLD